MTQLLSGLKVLDLTRLFPGPLCTMIMADYGADVIKVEDIWKGDAMRYLGPPGKDGSSFFRQLNRNKKSISLNMKTDEGIDIIKKIAGQSDILLEGFRPGVMKRLGLDYEEIKKINPKLVYASISGYGQDGPYAHKAGHDINYTALTGFLDTSRREGSAPEVSAMQAADIGGGALMALSGIMMALYNRERTGVGEYIDIAMADGLMPWMVYASSYHFDGFPVPRGDVAELTGAYACYNIYETSDKRYISLGAVEQEFWERFIKFSGQEEWLDKQYNISEQETLKKEIAAFFGQKTQKEWIDLLAEEDFCCDPVLAIDEVNDNIHMNHRQFFIDVAEREGEANFTKQVGFPLRFGSHNGKIRNSAPGLGDNSAEILSDHGYNENMIKSLSEKGIIKIS